MTATAATILERVRISPAKALDLLAGEIAMACHASQHLDDTLGKMLELIAPEERLKVMQDLHAIDLLNQHLTALANFARDLGLQASEEAAVDLTSALSHITLGDVVKRIEGAATGVNYGAENDDGDLDLF
ncbi:MAG: hypothetical protein Q7V15_10950 [Phenylobacterium sp.]|uniref:hypothetical protein n=1 Tax=Phenylobacterium sp. TaxID=1871053 RepID=UPI00271CB597|nr:hypothetical protein [Phenylobacterium sp.]MDO8901863.1 hypothetical protein [Phenylobacterium sp.]MDP2212592.1 hypothetical protein [Phenylobacterium sp.]